MRREPIGLSRRHLGVAVRLDIRWAFQDFVVEAEECFQLGPEGRVQVAMALQCNLPFGRTQVTEG